MALRDYTKRDCEAIDAAIFSGDQFQSLGTIEALETYIQRWQKELDQTKLTLSEQKSKTILIEKVNINLLRKQRDTLLTLESEGTEETRGYIQGVVNLLDEMLDIAEDYN